MLCFAVPPPPRTSQVILSVAEHHSNLVPWQMVAQKTGAVLKHVRLTPDTQELDMQVRRRGQHDSIGSDAAVGLWLQQQGQQQTMETQG